MKVEHHFDVCRDIVDCVLLLQEVVSKKLHFDLMVPIYRIITGVNTVCFQWYDSILDPVEIVQTQWCSHRQCKSCVIVYL